MADCTSNKPRSLRPDSHPNFFVVGIGASAGGLKALEEFFENMTVDSGAAFVVIQHLSPDFKSLMNELLGRHTRMAIHPVTDGMTLEKNSVYLIPPGKNLVLEGQQLYLRDRNLSSNRSQPNFPIDLFFKTLAREQTDCAIGIVLSGTGSDGTRGLQTIHEAGGITLVQDPTTAEFDGMPNSAIAAGLIDRVLPPSQLAQLVCQVVDSSVDRQDLTDSTNFSIDAPKIKQIAQILAQFEDTDFSYYKHSTLSRRIFRRCLIVRSDLNNYINLLQDSPEERKTLRNDLLIGVTRFFRDKSAWRFLKEEVLPKLLERVKPSEELRFWVSACSSGEEAYSLAMVVDEAVQGSSKPLSFKIFATDLDRVALEKADRGIYPEAIAYDVGEERLARYFTRRDGALQVARKLREKLIFAHHNLTKDAAFTRMHLVTCRNVLIYMQSDLQQQVLRNLHFSLQPQGILFLGESETLGGLDEEFNTLHKKWKLYGKRRDVRLSLPSKTLDAFPKTLPLVQSGESRRSRFEPILEETLRQLALDRNATYLLVDRDDRLLHVFGNSADIFKLPDGRVTQDVTRMVVPALKFPLRTAFHRAKQERRPVRFAGIELGEDENPRRVNLKVTYQETKKMVGDFAIVAVEPDDRPVASPTIEPFEADTETQRELAELEYELQQTRENLQATIEELESTNEEQQATNEELIASNEELQSTNEELHSVNEELYTVNAEYQSKIQELTELNDDMDNVLSSTEIGVIFLDRHLNIRKFTTAATAAINLVGTDIGRPLAHLAHNTDARDLLGFLEEALETERPAECEVTHNENHRHLLMRVHPYRQEDGQTDGVVLTFIDIDRLKKAEMALLEANVALQQNKERLNLALGAIHIGTWLWEPMGDRLIWDRRMDRLYGIELEARPQNLNAWLQFIHADDRDRVGRQMRQMPDRQYPTRTIEFRILLPDGTLRFISLRAKAYWNERQAFSHLTGVNLDITDSRQAADALRESEARLRQLNEQLEERVEERTTTLANFSANLKKLHRITTTHYDSIEALFSDYLKTGCEILGLSTGAIGVLDGSTYTLQAVVPETQELQVGMQFARGAHPCTPVLESGETLADDSSDNHLQEYAIYDNRSVSSFIGTPIWLDDRLYGTLEFFCDRSERRGFALYEKEIIELMARGIATEIAANAAQIDRQRANLALQESVERFRVTFEQAAVGLAHVAPDGPWLRVNQKICDIVGYTREELLEKTFQEITHPDDLEVDLSYVEQLLCNRIASYTLEKRYIHKNGMNVWINLTVSLVRDSTGKPKYFIAAIEDIGDRKRFEASLRESEERFRTLADSAPVLIWVSDTQQGHTFVNQMWLSFTGRSLETELGDDWTQGIHPEDLEFYKDTYTACFEGRQPFQMEYRLRRYDGEYRWLLDMGTPRFTGDGNFVGYIGCCTDVTEMQRTREALWRWNLELEGRVEKRTEELARAKEAAEIATQSKSAFIAHMSHELRTPLNGILGFTQILQKDTALTTGQKKGVNVIHQCGAHLLMLINDILYLSKIEAGKLKLAVEDFYFRSFLDNLVEIFRVRATDKGISFTFQAQTNLPMAVRGDETRLRQVLLNLLSNAVKFTQKGGVQFEVGYVKSQTSGDRKICFTIEDTGIGIPSARLADIFLPFQQLTDIQNKSEGTGLGLTISQNIIRQLGGEIQVSSTPGRGSRFWFEVDLPEIEIDRPDLSGEPQRRITGFVGDTLTILVVDDKDENREVLRSWLQPLGFTLIEARNGGEAWEKAIAHLPDLILLDLVMPVLDGFEVARRIRKEPTIKDVPIVANSASILAEDRAGCYDAGCDAFLIKPIVLERLLNLLQEQLGLEWVYEDIPLPALTDDKLRSMERSEDESLPVTSPPPETLEQLLELTRQGDIRGILQQAELLVQTEEQWIPFANRVGQLAESFQEVKLREWLEELLTGD
ncbi:PAS domain S-box protein [Oscillatoriales cyanobacterium LEGE 11467]|uniref:Circadian input-output histidine kinase CikA n=1 Tax=Zarconia navalis LEGE 11467 TaxID=1828826 RepID=A0A928VZR4_9CYAN|nr:PAS domain S-box protein [Zarconia navalis]MBE9041311.1 PAS domain S-box protein [Zarconia navalis LEGE 11467]